MPIFQMGTMSHREVRVLTQDHAGSDAEPGLPGARKQINTSQSWVSDRRSKETMGGSVRMGRDMGIRKGLPEGANPRAAGEMEEERAFQPATACTKALGQGRGASAGTNSSEVIRSLDLVQIFQNTNQQMPLRVSDAFNLF